MPRPITWLTALAAVASVQGQPAELFEKEVRPLFAAKCLVCHGSEKPTAGLDLSTAAGFRNGADVGPLIVGDSPSETRLIRAVRYQDRVKMPPAGKLSDREIAALTEWVRLGARWPQTDEAELPSQSQTVNEELWSLRPVNNPQAPAVADSTRVHNEIDRFWLRKLEEAELAPTEPADKRTLLRRVTFDLTGLPPTSREVDAFVADESPSAFAKVVDHLLDSPRYGEQWGRRWLDVARYADSTGQDEDHHYPYAWRYRDYVIEAFNSNLPYDQFVREQIAGDLLPAEDSDQVNARGIIATGFLALGPRLLAEVDRKKMFYDLVDEQIDTTSKAFLGLTIACARCHDHKFDPISTRDYYGLASIFASTRQFEDIGAPGMRPAKLLYVPLVPSSEARPYYASLKKIDAQRKEIDAVLRGEKTRFGDLHRQRLADYMAVAWSVYEGREDAHTVARAEGLDAGVLRRWVDYLKPPQERRPFLDEWYAAEPSEIGRTARRYQTHYEDVKAHRAQELDIWKKADEEVRRAGAAPPPKPRYMAGDDRFHTDMNSASGPFRMPNEDSEQAFSVEVRQQLERLRAKLKELEGSAPDQPPLACGVSEGEPIEQAVFIRGDWRNPGEIVAKRMLAAATPKQPEIRSRSGRLELANWIASKDNPLTARVMVNRIWQGHFGQGLVRTPSNFGRTGAAPAHPELLDYLANRFMESGWSVKAMHRLILSSAVYQTASPASAQAADRDPENRLLSHFTRRRLAAEEIRDALLSIGGKLDLTMGGTLAQAEGTEMVFMQTKRLSMNPDDFDRRSVYLPLRRSNAPSMFALFDFADRSVSSSERANTNVAPQALYLMNSPFVERQARLLAERLRGEPVDRVEQAHKLALGRRASPDRVETALAYLADFPGDSKAGWISYCRALLASSDFLYVD